MQTEDRSMDRGSAAQTLRAHFRAGRFAKFAETLVALTDPAERDGVAAWRHRLGICHAAMEGVSGQNRLLFMALVHHALEMGDVSFLLDDRDFAADIARLESGKHKRPMWVAQRIEERAALVDHPFAAAMRVELVYLDRAGALQALTAAWNQGNERAFFHLVETLAHLQNRRQRADDPYMTEQLLAEELATHPGLELAILDVSRGTFVDRLRLRARDPSMKIVISNAELPLEPDGAPREFRILTAQGSYASLADYLRHVAGNNAGSRGHGPYWFSSDNDRSMHTAVNVISTIHLYLAKPTNSEAAARERLAEEVRNIHMAALGPIYGKRYLRAQSLQPWMEAVAMAERPLSLAEDPAAVTEATEELVRHGMTAAVYRLIELSPAAVYPSVADGYLSGLDRLLDDLVEMANAPGELTETLERYERLHGFHPDVALFPVEERAKLAFRDLSDMALAFLTFPAARREHGDGMLIDAVPVLPFVHAMIAGGDVSNVIRIMDPLKAIRPELAAAVAGLISDAGYHVLPEYEVPAFGGMRVEPVIDEDGNFMLSGGSLLRHTPVAQVLEADDLTDAVLMRTVLNAVEYPPELRSRKAEQMASLDDFVARRRLVLDLKKEVDEKSEHERELFVAELRWNAEEIARTMLPRDHENPEETVAAAIDEVAGQKAKPLFRRVVKALNGVAGLVRQKP
jgi:hypothetical protein